MEQVLKSPNELTMINDLINNYSQKNADKVDYYPVSHRDRRSCSMPNMLQILKIRRDIFHLWKHSTRHYRGGQEAGRATNQQSIHHVRPWNSPFSIEEYSNGVDVRETLQESHNIKKARYYLGSAKKHKYGTTRSTKCACTNKDTHNPTCKNLTK